MSKVDDNLIQSILWYAIAAIWALIAIARRLSGEPEGSFPLPKGFPVSLL